MHRTVFGGEGAKAHNTSLADPIARASRFPAQSELSSSNALVLGVPKRHCLDLCVVLLTKDFDAQLCARFGQIRANHRYCQRRTHTVAPSTTSGFAHQFIIFPNQRHIGRVKLIAVDHQPNRKFLGAGITLRQNSVPSRETRLLKVDKAVKPCLKQCIIGRKISFPRAIPFLHAERVQGIHSKRLSSGCGYRVPDRGRVLRLAMHFPPKLSGE